LKAEYSSRYVDPLLSFVSASFVSAPEVKQAFDLNEFGQVEYLLQTRKLRPSQ
jgi:hypothetical protein